MDLERIDQLLRQQAARRLPPAPANLPENVWRAIRDARTAQRTQQAGWSLWLSGGWGEPRLAFASVALAVFIGAGLHRLLPPGHGTDRLGAASALDLTVFSAEPPALPSTLLAQERGSTLQP